MAEDVKRAIRACLNEADECERRGVWMSARDLRDHLRMALSALEAEAVAPAVDREALAERLFYIDGRDDWGVANEDERKQYLERAGTVMWLCEARDVRDVRKEGYDEGWEDAILEFAPEHGQAIREARNER